MKKIVLILKHIIYSGKVHASVGIGYKVEFDKKAFKLKCMTDYATSEEEAMSTPGADSGVETSVFTPFKRGRFAIKVLSQFRGETQESFTYGITVK